MVGDFCGLSTCLHQKRSAESQLQLATARSTPFPIRMFLLMCSGHPQMPDKRAAANQKLRTGPLVKIAVAVIKISSLQGSDGICNTSQPVGPPVSLSNSVTMSHQPWPQKVSTPCAARLSTCVDSTLTTPRRVLLATAQARQAAQVARQERRADSCAPAAHQHHRSWHF